MNTSPTAVLASSRVKKENQGLLLTEVLRVMEHGLYSFLNFCWWLFWIIFFPLDFPSFFPTSLFPSFLPFSLFLFLFLSFISSSLFLSFLPLSFPFFFVLVWLTWIKWNNTYQIASSLSSVHSWMYDFSYNWKLKLKFHFSKANSGCSCVLKNIKIHFFAIWDCL